MEGDGRLTRGMLVGNFANRLDGIPPHPPSSPTVYITFPTQNKFAIFSYALVDLEVHSVNRETSEIERCC